MILCGTLSSFCIQASSIKFKLKNNCHIAHGIKKFHKYMKFFSQISLFIPCIFCILQLSQEGCRAPLHTIYALHNNDFLPWSVCPRLTISNLFSKYVLQVRRGYIEEKRSERRQQPQDLYNILTTSITPMPSNSRLGGLGQIYTTLLL